MNEQQQPPIIESEPETQDEIEEKQRLKAAFADMEKNQLALLDSAGKSVIERVATFLVILLCYLVAMALGMLAIQPRSYTWYRYQTKEMAKTLQDITAYKKRLVQWAGILFALGTVLLAVLIVSLIWKV
jgi:p-aminobenzoyl-glutamate transporter AbgT